MTQAVIVTDVRAVLLMAALNLARRGAKARPGHTLLVASERALAGRDYGMSAYPRLYNSLKFKYLARFHGLVLVPAQPHTRLGEKDELGIVSSICSMTEDSFASRDKYPQLYAELENLARGAIEVNEVLRRVRPDTVYIFNGRIASQYPTVVLCRSEGFQVKHFEYAWTRLDGFNLYDFPPHMAYEIGRALAARYTERRSDRSLDAGAERFRSMKLGSALTAAYTWAPDDGYDVVVFLSSDFEYTNLDEEFCGLISIGSLRLCKEVRAKYGPDTRIAVRAHPNQTRDKSAVEVLAPVKEFCERNGMAFFGPDSGVSSHELIRKAKVVAIDCSSIGVDAVLLGTEVEIFGRNDLAGILASLPESVRADRAALQREVARIYAIGDEPFFVRFNVVERAINGLLIQLDRVMWHAKRLLGKARLPTPPARTAAAGVRESEATA